MNHSIIIKTFSFDCIAQIFQMGVVLLGTGAILFATLSDVAFVMKGVSRRMSPSHIASMIVFLVFCGFLWSDHHRYAHSTPLSLHRPLTSIGTVSPLVESTVAFIRSSHLFLSVYFSGYYLYLPIGKLNLSLLGNNLGVWGSFRNLLYMLTAFETLCV